MYAPPLFLRTSALTSRTRASSSARSSRRASGCLTWSGIRWAKTRVNPSRVNPRYSGIWLYLDAEVLVLPPVFYPQDSCFVGRRLFVVNQLPPTRSQFRLLCWCGLSMHGVSVIPHAVSLRVSISQSTGILEIPLPALLSNMAGCCRIYMLYAVIQAGYPSG